MLGVLNGVGWLFMVFILWKLVMGLLVVKGMVLLMDMYMAMNVAV